MNWDEPRVVAERIAAQLGLAVVRGGEHGGGVVLLNADELGAVADERLAEAAATVVVGTPDEATSDGLSALAGTVAQRGAAVVLTSFATVAGGDGRPADAPLVVAAGAERERVAELLAAGPHSLTLDSAVDVAALPDDAPPARVCVVSFEVSGMTGGGIGTASTSLAEALARAGHDVTLLFTGWQESGAEESNARWQEHYAARGVRLEILRRPGSSSVKSPHFPARSAYEVYCWLRAQEPFDVVHLPENMGHGVYAQQAKAHGAAFADTTFVIGTHGPTRWAAEANRVALTREEFLVNDALERRSVELADVLLGPSRYLHDYLRARGWTLPERVHVQPYAVPSAVRAQRGERDAGETVEQAASRLPDEIVFFGRIETRKGVVTLCDALDLLAGDGELPPFSVTFLGPVAEVLGRPADEYVAERAERWPWRPRIVSDRDQRGAAAYLARPGVLAVMPSTVDNAPNTVSEAIALAIPLVAGRTGGTGELIAAEQRDDHMFGGPRGLTPVALDEEVPPLDAEPLAALLRRRLTRPVEQARAPVAADAVDRAYDRWHRAVAARTAAAPPAVAPVARPQLAACLLFDGDERLLEAQLTALRDDVEVVVADVRADRSTAVEPAARRGAAVVAPGRPGHAAQARAAALAATRAELVAFVPPGDVPLPAFAPELRRAAAATAADVYSCAVLAERDGEPVAAFLPLPGPALAGLTHPAFCAGPYAIRRAALEALGGFAADAHGDEADHELLNRAAIAGAAIEVIAEPLAWKARPDRWSTLRAVWPHETVAPPYDAEQWLRAERPFAARADAAEDLVGLLRGTREEATRLRADVHDAHAAYEARIAEQRRWIDDLEQKAEQWRGDHAMLVSQLDEARAEAERLRRLNDELSQSAAQLAVRTVRSVGKRLDRKLRR